MTPPTPKATPDAGARVTVDMKVPLWGLISAAGAGFVLFAGLYFNVQSLTEAVRELQITVKSGNTSVSVLTSEMALLKFRTGTLEADVARINEIQRNSRGGK